MDKAEARKILQKHIARGTVKKYIKFCAMPEDTDVILEAMDEYAQQVSRDKEKTLIAAWKRNGSINIDVWNKINEVNLGAGPAKGF